MEAARKTVLDKILWGRPKTSSGLLYTDDNDDDCSN